MVRGESRVRHVGPYVLGEVLGHGGHGTVWSAIHEETGVRMAIKLIHAPSPEVRALVEQEVAIGRSVDSPHVLLPTSSFEFEQEIGIVYPLVVGQTVESLLRAGALAPGDAVAIARAAARGLATVHAHGFVHRDVKPANILVPFDGGRPNYGGAIVTDFGVLGELQSSGQTTAGMVVGTPAYMSPEQLSGSSQGPATDVYGLAAVLYEMLYGRRLYEAENLYALMEEVTRRPVAVPPGHPGVPEALRRLLLRSLSKSMAARPRDASVFLAELERAAGGLDFQRLIAWPSAPGAPASAGPRHAGSVARGTPSPDDPTSGLPAGAIVLAIEVDEEDDEEDVEAYHVVGQVARRPHGALGGPGVKAAQPVAASSTAAAVPMEKSPSSSVSPRAARRGRWRWLVLPGLILVAAFVLGPVFIMAGPSSGSPWPWLLSGLSLIAAGLAIRSALHRYLTGRESELSRRAANLLSGAESREALTQSLAIRLDELWEQCHTGEQVIVWHTVAMMVREYRDARESGDRQSALMNIVSLVGELQRRLSPWYIRHEKLVSFGVGMVGITSGLVTTAIAIAKVLGQ